MWRITNDIRVPQEESKAEISNLMIATSSFQVDVVRTKRVENKLRFSGTGIINYPHNLKYFEVPLSNTRIY